MESTRKVLPLAMGLVAATMFAFGAVGVGCDDDDEVTTGEVFYPVEDPYLYDYYYMGDLAYSGLYWSDSWDYDTYLYLVTTSGTTVQRPTVGAALRALARGESVCPGQVTVTPKMGPQACVSETPTVRTGVTIVFTGCQLMNGGRLDGTFDVSSTRTASEATCTANTTITLSHTTTLTNLAYTGPDGRRLVIPNQTDTGTNTYTFGQLPTTATINSTGREQIFGANGALLSDHNFNGTRTFTFSGADRSYSVSGMINTQDNVSGATATLSGTDVKHTQNCCRPTGGSLVVNRSGGDRPGQHTWTFEDSCGEATFDGSDTTLPACL